MFNVYGMWTGRCDGPHDHRRCDRPTDRLPPLPLFSKWTSDRSFLELPLEHLLKSIICFQNDCCRRLSSKHSPQMGLECLVNLDLKKALPLKCARVCLCVRLASLAGWLAGVQIQIQIQIQIGIRNACRGDVVAKPLRVGHRRQAVRTQQQHSLPRACLPFLPATRGTCHVSGCLACLLSVCLSACLPAFPALPSEALHGMVRLSLSICVSIC
eukprot:COSAG06_NODE_1625_length_8891_cov_55.617379_6_plen_213_part_00